MQCTNKACGKFYEKPLELFNGSWHCPHCKQSIYPSEESELVVDAENNEKFVLSELIFNEQWLLNKNNVDRTERYDALKKAINLCEEAAFSYNPYALVNLGYYHQNGYVDPNSTTEERMRKAYIFFNAVLFNKNASIKAGENDKKVNNLPDSEFIKLKKTAGINAFNILNNLNENSAAKVLGRAYNLSDVKTRIINKLKELGETEIPLNNKNTSFEEGLNIETVFSYICPQSDYSSPPIFGVFLLNPEQLKLLIEKSYFTKNNVKKTLGSSISDGLVTILVAEAYNNSEARGSFRKISTEKELEALAQNKEESHFLFFCKTGKGLNLKYLKWKAPVKIYKSLTKRDNEYIMEMIVKNLTNRYVFSEDDIYFCLKKNDYDQTIETLIKMCEGE